MGFENGTIFKWNDQKGYGFIKPDSENSQIFVHVSAFGRIVRRPVAGDRVYFDTIIEQGGKRKVKVARILENSTPAGNPRQRSLPSRPVRRNAGGGGADPDKKRKKNALLVLAVLLLIIGIGKMAHRSKPDGLPANSNPEATAAQPAPKFKCEGKRNCSQMTSMEEAKFYLENCPHDGMDGDGDGIPCERQFGN